MDLKEKIESIMAAKNLTVEELAKEVGLSVAVLRSALKGKGTISKYGKEKLENYCADGGVWGEHSEKKYIEMLGDALVKYVSNNMELEADVSYDGDTVTVGMPITFLEFDRGAYISMLGSANSSLLIYIVFGGIEATFDAYELINAFNLSQPIFKAIINEDGNFELQFSLLESANINQTVDTVDFVLTRLFEAPYEELLKPIAALIKKEDTEA